MKKLTAIQKELILGSLMGDAGLAKRGNSFRVRFAHSEKQKAYLQWKYTHLKSIVSMNILKLVSKLKGIKYFACSFTTLSSNEFSRFYDLFYVNNVKVINSKMLNLLTTLSLAVWYMDDGCLIKEVDNRHNKKKVRYRCNLSLGKVSLDEAKIVQMYFKQLGIESHVITGYNKVYNRNYPLVKFTFPGTRKFIELVKSYIPECMLYKLPLIPVTTTRRESF